MLPRSLVADLDGIEFLGSDRKPNSVQRVQKKRRVSAATVNFVLDTFLALAFLSVVFASCIVVFVFPSGPEAGGWMLWGLDYKGWSYVQVGCLGVFTLGVLLHLVLHWNWVCGYLANRASRRKGMPVVLDEGTRTLLGVGLLVGIVTLVGMLLGAAVIMLQSPGN